MDNDLPKLQEAAELLRKHCVPSTEAADQLDVKKQTVDYYLRTGELTPIRIFRSVLIPRAQLKALAAKKAKK